MNNTSVMKLKIELSSPVIVLPFKTDGSMSNECWVLNLGKLSVNTVEDVLKPNQSLEMKALDMYDISLSKIKLSYFPSIEYYNNYITNPDLKKSLTEVKFYHTIEDFSINIAVSMVKGPA